MMRRLFLSLPRFMRMLPFSSGRSHLRLIALQQAVKAANPLDLVSVDDVVTTAEKFLSFLERKDEG
jgi:hypothetical protein